VKRAQKGEDSMKQLKKVGAVLLALAMIAVMIPQMGSTVKAGTPASTDEWDAREKKDNDTVGVIQAYVASGKKGLTTSGTAKDPDGGDDHKNGFKTQSSTYFNIIVPAGKFVKVTIVATTTKTDVATARLQLDENTNSDKTITAQNGTTADKVTFDGYLTEGTHKLSYNGNQIYIYRVIADIYDNEADVPADAVVSKVKVSGSVTSPISLEGGHIVFNTYEGNLTLKSGTTDVYEYELTDVIGDNTEYNVSVVAPAITEGMMNVDASSFGGKTTVGSTDMTGVDFTLKYINIDGLTWDFKDTSKNWQKITFQYAEEKPGQEKPQTLFKYKGLDIDVSAAGSKFDVQSDKVQVNKGTKVKIPVSGWGTVTCTFNGKVSSATTLGSVAGNSTTTITAPFVGSDQYVELNVGTDSTYLEKIEVTADKTAPVTTRGASVREETADWGNGIRFGGQLDLTKVDKDTCESGTLIGLESTVGEGVDMTITDVDTKCVKVVRKTYIEETATTLDYAAALINIPDEQLDTKIVARPYVTIDGNTYYGKQISTTYNNAKKLAASAK